MVKPFTSCGIFWILVFHINSTVILASADKQKSLNHTSKAQVGKENAGRELKTEDNDTITAGTILFPETHLSTLKRDFNITANVTAANVTDNRETVQAPFDSNGLITEDEDEDNGPLSSSIIKISNERNSSSIVPKHAGKNETLCSKAVNLLFLLDSSESVKYQHWSLILDFVKDVAHRFNLAQTKLGIIRYASEAEIALPLTKFYDENARNNAIDDIFYKTGGTRTDVALEKAAELLHSVEKQTSSQVLILVTDGPTNALEINKNKFVEGKDLVQGPGDALKSEGVAIFCVGIEPDSVTPEEMQTMKEEMKIIASEPKSSHVFISDGYRELQRKVDSVSKAACVVNGAWSQWSEFSPCTVTCGYGTKVRIRTCTNPKPENNGADCTGSRVENKPCYMGSCIAFVGSTLKEAAANVTTPITQTAPVQGPIQNFQVIQNVVEEIQKYDDRQPGCPNGYEEIHLRDDQYTASSTYNKGIGDEAIMKMHAPNNGRLNNVDNAGSWCAEHRFAVENNKNQYLQLNLDNPEQVAMVATQGSHEYNNWVKAYSIDYSNDGRLWLSYKNKAKLDANVDKDTPKRQILNPPLRARHFRLTAQDWHKEGGAEIHDICMRAALYKCSDKIKSREDLKGENVASVMKRSDLPQHSTSSSSRIHETEDMHSNRDFHISKRILGRLRKMAKHIIKKMKNNHGNSA